LIHIIFYNINIIKKSQKTAREKLEDPSPAIASILGDFLHHK